MYLAEILQSVKFPECAMEGGFEEKQFSIPINIRVCIRLINGVLGIKCVTSNLVTESM
jgi:hypothetical protein